MNTLIRRILAWWRSPADVSFIILAAAIILCAACFIGLLVHH